MQILWKSLLAVLLSLIATKNYNTKVFQPGRHSQLFDSDERGIIGKGKRTAQFKFGFLEFDDEGRVFNDRDVQQGRPDSTAMDSLLDDIRRTASQQSTTIVVFAHGWHHNASQDDGDLKSFLRYFRSSKRLAFRHNSMLNTINEQAHSRAAPIKDDRSSTQWSS